MSDDLMNLEPVRPGRRRRYTPEQKRALLDHAAAPGGSISETARTFGVAPSLLFQWKRVMDDATKKGLNANVDFYSASTYHLLGIPIDLFTPIFAIARTSGWTAHVLEQLADNRLIRPRGVYDGPDDLKFKPISER